MSTLGHNRLSDLAGRVREAASAMQRASKEAAECALAAGRLLIEAKEECRHGEWLPFLDKAGMHERQARRLMQLARSGLTSDTVSDLGIKGALELLASRKLPQRGMVLQVSVEPAETETYGGTAWVWESEEHPGYFHAAGVSRELKQAVATRKPVDGKNPEAVFETVDQILEHRHESMCFEAIQLPREFCDRFRLAVSDEQDAQHYADQAVAIMQEANARLSGTSARK